MATIEQRVTSAFRRLEAHPRFQGWIADENPREGDLVVVNNSFVFRDVETEKSPLYLVAEVGPNSALMMPSVARLPARQNVDLRRMGSTQARPPLQTLREAISDQSGSLGLLVFALISSVVEDRTALADVRGGPITRVVWNPAGAAALKINGDTVEVNTVDDEELLWSAFQHECTALGLAIPDTFKAEFAEALDVLIGRGSASLRLPARRSRTRTGVLDSMLKSLRRHLADYRTAVAKYGRAQDDDVRKGHFNEILRVAYTFAQDASTLLRLIVSVCDLKPLVLWATIDKQFHLSETLKDLPWTRSRRKASLSGYLSLVNDSRNRAFHNAFPFEKALCFELPEGALIGAELRIFSEFGSRAQGNELSFHDKALADAMLSFTRARQRPTPDSFWKKNEVVMESMIDLFSMTNSLLKDLYDGYR